MVEDKLFQELRTRIASDLSPVSPLWSPWRMALSLPFVLIPMAGLVLALFGVRRDHETLGLIGYWGPAFLQAFFAYGLFWLGVRTVIPGMAVSRLTLWIAPVVSLGISIALSWISFQLSPAWAEAGQEWRTGLACLAAMLALALLPLFLGWLTSRRGLPLLPRFTGIVIGIGAGLGAEAVWRLHCPVSSLDHVVGFHIGAVVLVSVIGLSAGHRWLVKVPQLREGA